MTSLSAPVDLRRFFSPELMVAFSLLQWISAASSRLSNSVAVNFRRLSLAIYHRLLSLLHLLTNESFILSAGSSRLSKMASNPLVEAFQGRKAISFSPVTRSQVYDWRTDVAGERQTTEPGRLHSISLECGDSKFVLCCRMWFDKKTFPSCIKIPLMI
ncbi:unnamed protein product [Microthlaspi erraticum]|uniref:Uncharacterized protein n=1 Tax=Microthlaspi erraticum TaxID=1685480 RepID=A0A6D2KUM0_9BRAS|nr:unnamed protein product [Microthlaspi erraticum]